jgi:hypothetical protein
LLRAHAAGRAHLDLRLAGGEIVEALDLDLAFARGVFDGGDQHLRRGRRRNLLDDDSRVVLDLDLGAHLDLAGAVAIFARIHQAAGLEIGQDFE